MKAQGKTAADEVLGGRFRPRFTPAQKNELLSRLRITKAQVQALERALPEVAGWLKPLARTRDVRDELKDMNRHLRAAARRLMLWRAASSRRGVRGEPSPMAEALGHFNVAAPGMRDLDGSGVDLHEDLDPAAIISMAAYIARMALEQAPSRKRNLVRAAPEAIGVISRALSRPNDEISRERTMVTQPGRAGNFSMVARVVWEAVLGNSEATPTRSIQEFLRARG